MNVRTKKIPEKPKEVRKRSLNKRVNLKFLKNSLFQFIPIVFIIFHISIRLPRGEAENLEPLKQEDDIFSIALYILGVWKFSYVYVSRHVL